MTVSISFVASGRKRGKTTLVESLTKTFSKDFKVWTVKHVSESFDTPDKDTWRHTEAGAQGTVVVAPNRLVVLMPRSLATLEAALGKIPEDADLVLIEGFRASDKLKVLVALSKEEAEEELGRISGVFAVAGPIADTNAGQIVQGVPVVSLDQLKQRLALMVLEDRTKRLPGIDCKKCGYPTCRELAEAILKGRARLDDCRTLRILDLTLKVDGEQIFLSEFPKNFVKNVILGMTGSLKGVDIRNAKRITIDIDVQERDVERAK